MLPEPSCALRQQAHRPTVHPPAEAAQSSPGPSPTSDPWGGPSRARGSDSGAWDLLRQEKSRRERGRGQARSEQGRCPPSPAPEEGPLGQAPPKQLVGMSLTHRTQLLKPGNRQGSACVHCTRQKPDQRQATLSVEDRPRWPPVPRGRQDRCGGVNAVHERKHTLHTQHCSFQFFLSV